MTNSAALITPTTNDQELIIAAPEFDLLVEMIAPEDENAVGVVAASSARVYRVTYEAWRTWCIDSGSDPLAVNFATVGAFLHDRDGTKSSQQRELSALRTLAKTLQIVDYLNPARFIIRELKRKRGQV